MKQHAVLLLLSLIVFSCAEKRELLFRAGIISLNQHAPPSIPLKKGKYTSIRWCSHEKPYIKETAEKREPAYLDQLIAKASEIEKAEYFIEPVFYIEPNCMLMSAYVGQAEGAKPK